MNFDCIFGKVDLSEYNKLTHFLDEKDIPYEERSRCGGKGLAIPSYEVYNAEEDERRISVICFDGSYGSKNGLLEIYAPGLNEGVEGYLTAEECMSYITDTLNGISRGSTG